MLSTTPRTSRNRYWSAGSAMESATRGSLARLRNFWRVLVWVIRIRSPSQANHMTLDCGEPSGRTVARWANVGFSRRSAWLSGGFTDQAWHDRRRDARGRCEPSRRGDPGRVVEGKAVDVVVLDVAQQLHAGVAEDLDAAHPGHRPAVELAVVGLDGHQVVGPDAAHREHPVGQRDAAGVDRHGLAERVEQPGQLRRRVEAVLDRLLQHGLEELL